MWSFSISATLPAKLPLVVELPSIAYRAEILEKVLKISIYDKITVSQSPLWFPSLAQLRVRLDSPPSSKVQHDLLAPTGHRDALDIAPDTLYPFPTASTGQTNAAKNLNGVANHMLEDDTRMGLELGCCAC